MGDGITTMPEIETRREESYENALLLNGSYSKTIIEEYDRVRHIPLDDAYALIRSQKDLDHSAERLKGVVEAGDIHVYNFDGDKYLDRLDIGRVYHRPVHEKTGLTIERYFSEQGKDPLEEDYKTKHLKITDVKGKVIYETHAEFPTSWDDVSAQIVAQKYFFSPKKEEWKEKLREKIGTPKENSIRHLTTRVSNFFADKGFELGYFSTPEDRERFRDELMALQIQRKIAFNSPVQFNAGIFNEYGIEGSNNVNWIRNPDTGELRRLRNAEFVYPQCHACFIKGPRDDLESILTHVIVEGSIFSAGSGIGQNIGDLREARAPLSGGGMASGALSYLKIYDDSAETIKSGGKSRRAARMTMIDQDHPDILKFIRSKVGEDKKALTLMKDGYEPGMDGEAYTTVTLQNTNLTVRLDDSFFDQLERGGEIELIGVKTREITGKISAERMMKEIAFGAWRVGDPAVMYTSVIDKMHTAPNSGRQRATNPCGEYMFLNDTSCNLASGNVAAFSDEKGNFDVEAYQKANRIMAIAQDIANDAASYPVRDIAEISPEFRTIGTGFTGLGKLLMRKGIPYDSDKARALAGAISAIMTGAVYETSIEMAEKLGTFTHFEFNREPMLEVMKKHGESLDDIVWEDVDDDQECTVNDTWGKLRSAAYESWNNVGVNGQKNGFRNAQATVIAPTGTISYLMGTQDSTGIEPPVSLVIGKDLAGGGRIKITNAEVPNALKNLGYDEDQITEIVEYITEEVEPDLSRNTVIGAPHLNPNHYDIFSTAFGNHLGEGSIGIQGHVGMMGAVQPFISGGISKTNNFSEHATAKDVYDTFLLGHELGTLKGITVFRNNSKPVSAMNFGNSSWVELKRGEKEDLPFSGDSFRQEVKIGGAPFLINIGEYEDGRPAEVVIESYSGGSTLGNLLRIAGISASTSLKRGVSLESVVKGWIGHEFSPIGFVTIDKPSGPHPLIKQARSPLDFVGKLLLIHYRGQTDLATEPEEVDITTLRGFTHGAFRAYKRQETDDWDIDVVLADPELGGFVEDKEESIKLNNGKESNKQLNNRRGLTCEKCGNIMRQTSSNCFTCQNCPYELGGCGQ